MRNRQAAPSPQEPFETIIRGMISPYRAMDDFLDDGLRRGWSERTLSTYRRVLYAFGDTLPVDCDVSEIKTDNIRRFLGAKKGNARGTIAHAEAVLASWLKWCYLNQKVKANPMDRLARTKRIRAEDLDVTSVSADDVRKLFAAADALDALAGTADREVWTHRCCIGILAYMGPRRRAVSRLRLRDYDTKAGQLRFREKGNKVIWKPAPDELRTLIDGAVAAGAIVKQTDFLVPPAPYAFYAPDILAGKRERDDRCIWEIVRALGAKAGVVTHVHALRAAFAVFYLEQHPGELRGLQELLGHSSIATTAIYLRKLEKATAMEPVRGLSWAKPERAAA
jgi:integrase/recombinase XerC